MGRARHNAFAVITRWLYLAVGLLVILFYLLLPGGSLAQGLVFVGVHLLAVVVLTIGIRRHGLGRSGPWLLVAAGQTLYLLADVVWFPLRVALHQDLAFPSAADGLYMLSYATLLLGFGALIRVLTPKQDRQTVLDVLIVTLGIGTFFWLYLIHPALDSNEGSLLGRLVAVAYPLTDLLLIAILLRLSSAVLAPTPALGLLTLSILSQLGTDLAYAIAVLQGAFALGSPITLGWLLSWAFLGAAVLHPSVRELSRPMTVRGPLTQEWRLAALTVAALSPPAALVIQSLRGEHDDVAALAGIAGTLFALVLVRMHSLIVSVADYERTERALAARAEQLLQTNEQLLELDRIKSDFVSTTSHELRTPLTSIRGYIELLTDGEAGELNPTQRRMVEAIDRNAARLLTLIEDILTLAKIESGTFRLTMAPVAVADIVSSALQAVAPSLGARQLDLVVNGTDDVGCVQGDAAQLERVLLNLLTNAIKFSPDGGRVLLTASGGTDEVELMVTDYGVGIPAPEQDRLFTRFFRASTAAVLAIQGTGLGLAVVKSIVDGHKGSIRLDSAPGLGTTVAVTLPRHQPASASPNHGRQGTPRQASFKTTAVP
jgi:signal transduction histidine kinase